MCRMWTENPFSYLADQLQHVEVGRGTAIALRVATDAEHAAWSNRFQELACRCVILDVRP